MQKMISRGVLSAKMGCTHTKIIPIKDDVILFSDGTEKIDQSRVSPLIRRSISNRRTITSAPQIFNEHSVVFQRYQQALYDINIMSSYQQMYFNGQLKFSRSRSKL